MNWGINLAGSSKSKSKILYLFKILHEKSDDEDPLTVEEIISELKKYDINSERKSIYSDLRLIEEFGIDICRVQGKKYGYFIGNRDFEIPELRLMIDAIQSAKFITVKKSKELIKKIEGLTSEGNAKKLENQVFINDRIKYENEEIYYNVDKIYTGIMNNRMISFQYYQYDISKKQVLRNIGMEYKVSPYALSWVDDQYYMIANFHKYDNLSHYRIDRICNVNVLEESRRDSAELSSYRNYFNVADYSKKIYNMFSGTTEVIEVRFSNHLIDTVIDKFGVDITIKKHGDKHFIIHTEVSISDGFISWLMIFGDEIEIISPLSLRERIKGKADRISNVYK